MIDLRCYVITSGNGPDVVAKAAAAAGAGAGVIQVREKHLSARELLRLTLDVGRAVHEANPSSKVVVNDRVDVALAALRESPEWVQGVHLGQDDLPAVAARELLGPDAVIGLTTGTLELVRAADKLAGVIDYVGSGPFRRTPTKDSGREPLGLAGYPAMVSATRLPVVAIGDVQAADAPALAEAGVAGVAVVRAVMGADDPAAVVREILAAPFASFARS
ncbi:thiamine phosphate synthase [Tessaracoccus sp. ZS01]|uniref:thiamine phosphate synthase n=1 Tax=Tessaracoccus sp. ZS01 TaxID=1906324 RepID=UPI00096F85C4|nr:thiamine phosphate synthase [Tessaracoccus sp. ZS01]MCG6568406.1 thiamine phosphate synthase [Tessaracoccus sp. ZS01]OMG52811.1 thiamine-phosphate diphosphorylase [Tessaracoccus sp. ZS01]